MTPNELVNSVCKKYASKKALPGYDPIRNVCVYFSKSMDENDIPFRCAIGISVPLEIAIQLENNRFALSELDTPSSVDETVLKTFSELLDHSNFKKKVTSYDFEILNKSGIQFLIRLQGTHDSYCYSKNKGDIKLSLSEHIWTKMNERYPELITEHFLTVKE